jgi:hypothetical protein
VSQTELAGGRAFDWLIGKLREIDFMCAEANIAQWETI